MGSENDFASIISSVGTPGLSGELISSTLCHPLIIPLPLPLSYEPLDGTMSTAFGPSQAC